MRNPTRFGTVVGAYFGIKLSSATVDKTRNAVEKANDRASWALAALEPQVGMRIMDEELLTVPKTPLPA